MQKPVDEAVESGVGNKIIDDIWAFVLRVRHHRENWTEHPIDQTTCLGPLSCFSSLM
ncbi:MAG: hypothetical protein AAF982_01615 [Pseudomonadota bacterium]